MDGRDNGDRYDPDEQARAAAAMTAQGGRLFPVGEALRATYDAENHDSLDGAVTGLMIDLSRVPFDEAPIAAVRVPAMAAGTVASGMAVPAVQPVAVARASLLRRVWGLVHR